MPQNISVSSYGGDRWHPAHPKISWTKNSPSSPLQAISGYEIYRLGSLIATTSATDSFYVDNDVNVGSGGITIYYKVKAKDVTTLRSGYTAQVSIGSSNWLEKHQAEDIPVVAVPTEFALKTNYPNPFNPVTKIKYELPIDNFVTLEVFNSVGQEIAMLVNEYKTAGYYDVKFNGGGLSSGVYFVTMASGDFKSTIKMILQK